MTTATESKRIEVPKGGQYLADRNDDGTWNVRDVAVFVENGDYTKDWLEAAVENAKKRRERDGYVAPLHVRHHDLGNPSALEAAAVEPAGMFAAKDVREIAYEGQQKAAVFADLLSVPDKVYQRIKARSLPYRSVEVLSKARQEIDSCALLDHEVPRFRLPLLTIGAEQFSEDRTGSDFQLLHDPEVHMIEPNPKGASGAQGAPKATPDGQAPGNAPAAPAAAPDATALATAIAQALAPALQNAVQAGMGELKTMITTKPGREAGDPPAQDAAAPVEQDGIPEPAGKKKNDLVAASFKAKADAETASRFRALEERANKAETFAAALRRERETDAAVASATKRLGKLGVKVDEGYETDLRAKAEKGTLDEHLDTREKFGAVDPPAWGNGPVRKTRRAEVQKYATKGPESLEKAERFAAEWETVKDSLPDVSLEEFLRVQFDGVKGVAVNGREGGN